VCNRNITSRVLHTVHYLCINWYLLLRPLENDYEFYDGFILLYWKNILSLMISLNLLKVILQSITFTNDMILNNVCSITNSEKLEGKVEHDFYTCLNKDKIFF
jgi:hypothetical protein